jgi:putative spermidine/putrescine transport system substrate-binding protein
MKRRRGLALVVLVLVAAVAVGLFLHFRGDINLGNVVGSGSELAVLGFGDEYPEAQRRAYIRPFTSETEIRIKEATYDGDYADLKGRLTGDSVPDVVQVDSSALMRGVKEDMFQPIGYGVVNKSELIPQAAHEFGVGTAVYSIALGWNPSKLPKGSLAPKSWSDFWDVKKYPGGRSLKKSPRFTLEIALMADGVSSKDLYKDGKLDVDRAFRKLDELKPHVKLWWTDAREPIRLLTAGEVVMAATRGERLSEAAHQEQPTVELTWNQGVMSLEFWAVPKAAHNPDQAMRFIAYANQSDRQATFATLLPLGPVNPKAFGHIEGGVARSLNSHPQNLSKQVFLDASWWAEHEEEIGKRFEKWLGE